jgi:hypothetical protein
MIAELSMRRSLVLVAGALGCVLGSGAQEELPKREMNVRQGPETVFEQPPAQLFPTLEGATATGENGRIGSEFVFWGYEQRDGRRVFLFACAARPDVDCAARVPAICPATTTVLETREAAGKTVRRNCRTVATIGPGEVRPGCADRLEQTTSLAVGLVSCG